MIRNILKKVLKTLQIPLTENLAIDINTEKIVKRLAQEGRISNCVDIGVLDGEILELFLKYIPKGEHSGVEPIPEKIELLKAKFKSFGNIHLYNFAAGSKNEESTFNLVVSNPSYSGLRKRDYPREEEVKEIKVAVKRLDDILPADRKIDLIKIDVEGAEYDVLLGAESVLSRYKPILIFEFGLGASNHYGVDAKMLYEVLAKHQYKIYTLGDWLKGNQYLTPEAFDENYRTNKHYYFIAE